MKPFVGILVGLCIIIASAYGSFTIPITETGIPFTLQSLAVFVIAAFLDWRQSIICLGLYLLIGALGLPVFAEGSSGFEKIMGPSGGFLIGFLCSGTFISYARQHIQRDNIVHWSTLMLLATVILFLFGLSQLYVHFDFSKAVEYGLAPFWKMAILKALLAALIVTVTYAKIY